MSRTIHGQSTKALKFLREKPAALSVYWCYVARMNNEGVAWPGVRGLANDTDWNKDTCIEARKLLVTLQALEEVKDYVRPEWRDLPDDARARKVNLDRSEYFRPTGYIIVEGQKYLLLYNGGDEVNEIDQKITDVRRGRTSAASNIGGIEHRRGRTELDSNAQPDSRKSKLASKGSAPDGAAPAKPSIEENKAVGMLIKAWAEKSGVIEANPYNKTGYRSLALAMHRLGISPEMVTDFLSKKRQLPFFVGKGVAFGIMTQDIQPWLDKNRPGWRQAKAAEVVVDEPEFKPLDQPVE